MKASPMAGLGSVEDRVSAYRGNPAPLQQRYAMSQDLLDLLALQKLKSEKEAAARQMQLAMGQQQAAQGGDPPTIAAQREKEVMDMTKNELAQQRGDTADQQVSQQQAMAQRMMGGIANAPGAANAAQPKMFASGGIVAFDAGGAIGYADGGEILDKARERRKAAQQKIYSYGSRQKRQDPEGFQAAQAELQAALAALQEAERNYAAEMTAAGIDKPISAASPMGIVGRYERAQAPAPAPAAVSEAQATAAAGPQAAVPPVAKPPMPPAPPAMPKPPGIAGLPGAALAAPAAPAAPVPGTPADPLAEALRKQSMEAMGQDPAAQRLAEESRIEGKLAFPEEQARRRATIDKQRQALEQEFDPERQRQEGLKRALIGAGGRRYGVLAGAATAGMNYDEAQGRAKRDRLKGVEDMEQGLFGLKKTAVEGGIGGGKTAFDQSSTLKRQGMDTGSRIYGTDVESRDKALNREIERLKVGAQNEANKIQREGLDLSRAQTLYSTTMNRMQQLERKLDEDFAGANGMLLMAQQSGKMDSAQKQQLEIAQLELQRQKAALRKEMEPVLAPIRQKLGATSGAGLSKADQSLVDQYLKK
jgi:hypothetical protein